MLPSRCFWELSGRRLHRKIKSHTASVPGFTASLLSLSPTTFANYHGILMETTNLVPLTPHFAPQW
jgi:hypothetical protein